MTRAEEIAALEAKARTRRGVPGYRANVAEIEARIARLKAEEPTDAG